MVEANCRCPGCGVCSAHIKEPKYKSKIKELTEQLKASQAKACAAPLSEADLANACLSYRHDFGLMSAADREKLMVEAREWARAFDLKVAK